MGRFIARVDLRGCADGAAYESMHNLMIDDGWSRECSDEMGQIALLPHGMYAIESEKEITALTAGVCTQLQTIAWPDTSMFCMAVREWAQAPAESRGPDIRAADRKKVGTVQIDHVKTRGTK